MSPLPAALLAVHPYTATSRLASSVNPHTAATSRPADNTLSTVAATSSLAGSPPPIPPLPPAG